MLFYKPFFISAVSLILISIVFSAISEEKVLYKKIDKNGRVIFTDKPLPGAKKVSVDTSKNVLTIPKVTSKARKAKELAEQNPENPYQVLAIEQPTNDETIETRNKSLYVIVALNPMLERNHSVRLLMDNVSTGSDQKVPYFTVTNLKRGTHNLMAQIIDDETGEIIQSSKTVTFHYLQATRPIKSNQ